MAAKGMLQFVDTAQAYPAKRDAERAAERVGWNADLQCQHSCGRARGCIDSYSTSRDWFAIAIREEAQRVAAVEVGWTAPEAWDARK